MKTGSVKVIAMGLCLGIVALAVSCSKTSKKETTDAPEETKIYHWRYGTVDAPANVNYRAMEELVKYLQEAAPDKWNIEFYPSSQLGNADEMVESIQMGSLEISGPPSSTIANYVPEFGVWDMPYLFRDEAHVDAVMSGPIGQQFGSFTEKANIKFLAWWEVGFRCLANNRRPVNGPEDVAGLRLRVMSNEIHQTLFSTLGADPVPMSLSDAYVANQNGTIDGQDNPLANLIANSTHEICKYIAVTNHVYTPLPLIMSLKAWNEMTADDQNIFMECLNKATTWQRDSNRFAQRNAASELTAKGNIVTYPGIADFEAKMQAVYDKYPQYADIIAQIKAVK
jgi:tripartite ATP-independent transporter DctP family solute receptor